MSGKSELHGEPQVAHMSTQSLDHGPAAHNSGKCGTGLEGPVSRSWSSRRDEATGRPPPVKLSAEVAKVQILEACLRLEEPRARGKCSQIHSGLVSWTELHLVGAASQKTRSRLLRRRWTKELRSGEQMSLGPLTMGSGFAFFLKWTKYRDLFTKLGKGTRATKESPFLESLCGWHGEHPHGIPERSWENVVLQGAEQKKADALSTRASP